MFTLINVKPSKMYNPYLEWQCEYEPNNVVQSGSSEEHMYISPRNI